MEQRATRGQPSAVKFKCMHPAGCLAGCLEGAHHKQKETKGAWHEAGTMRWAGRHGDKDKREGEWDGFCALHMEAAQGTSGASQGSPFSGAVTAGGSAEEGPVTGPCLAGGRKRKAAVGVKNRIKIAAELALLAAANPRDRIDEGSTDIPPPPQRRVQTHVDLEAAEVLRVTTRVVLEYCEGMARPKPDGTLKRGTGLWGHKTEASQGTLPFMTLPRAAHRAMSRKPVTGWDEASKRLALDDHVVSGTIIFVVPEVFNRTSLEADPAFRVLDESGVVKGVRMVCPCCLSNKHTAVKGWHKQVRAVHTASEFGNWFPIGYRYVCFNPTCDAVRKAVKNKVELVVAATSDTGGTGAGDAARAMGPAGNEAMVTDRTGGAGGGIGASVGIGGAGGVTQAKVPSNRNNPAALLATLSAPDRCAVLKGDLGEIEPSFLKRLTDGAASFLVTDKSYMKLFPRSVQICYNYDLLSKSGASHSLLTSALVSTQSIAAITRDFQEIYNMAKVKKVEEYAHFTQEQKGMWPQYRTIGSGTVLSGPTESNTRTYIEHKYVEILPRIRDDLANRSPGRSISCNSTHRFAKRSSGEAGCMTFVYGEYGHIVGHAAQTTESFKTLIPLLYQLKRRWVRLGTETDLQYVFLDTCCHKMENPAEHPVTSIFSNVNTGPKAGIFHKVKLIASSTRIGHALHAQFSTDVGACLARRYEPDLYRVARELVKGGMPAHAAMAEAAKPRYRRSVRTFTPEIAQCVRLLRQVENKYSEADKKGKADEEAAKARGETNVPQYIPLFMKRRGASISTGEAFDNVIACVKKGCLHSYPGVTGYSTDFISPSTNLPRFYCLGGASKNESHHSRLNGDVVSEANIISEARSQREVDLYVYRTNRTVDINRGFCKPDMFSGSYWCRQHIAKGWGNVDGPPPGGNMVIPPVLPEEHREYHGYEYLSNSRELHRRACVNAMGKAQAALIETMSSTPERCPVDDEPETDGETLVPSPTVEGASVMGAGLQAERGTASVTPVMVTPVMAAAAVAAAAVVAMPTEASAAASAAVAVTPEAVAWAAAAGAAVADSDTGAASELQPLLEGRGRGGKRRKHTLWSAPSQTLTTPDEMSLANRCLALASATPGGSTFQIAVAMYNTTFAEIVQSGNPKHLDIRSMTSEKSLREHDEIFSRQWQRQRLQVSQSSGEAGPESAPTGEAGPEEVALSSSTGAAEALQQLLRSLGSLDGVDSLSGNACLKLLRKHRESKAGLRNGLGTEHYRALVKEMLRDSQP